MSLQSNLTVVVYIALVTALAIPLGLYIHRVFFGEVPVVRRVLDPVETALLRLAGVQKDTAMDWKKYAVSVLVFNGAGVVLLYLLQRFQSNLPLNPGQLPSPSRSLAFNTAVSFVTNTNWQAYSGETTLSYLVQMLGLTVQNFLSAATGMAVLAALIRGIVQKQTSTLGNFWVDLVRIVLYVLLPLSFLFALFLVANGVVQTLDPSPLTSWISPSPSVGEMGATGTGVALGPVASQVAIKQLGTNGGGFFNANSAHPFENPTALSNLLQMVAILLLPASLCFTFGAAVKDKRQGIALFSTMLALFVPAALYCIWVESQPHPLLAGLPIDHTASQLMSGGNMEGKEVRFGTDLSALWATATTAASSGSVNASHDSFLPMGGMVPLWMILLGEIVFGGVGSGLYGLLAYVLVAVLLAGLMVGRTPEYLGKKIEAFEMKMVSLVILIPACTVLVATAVAVSIPQGTSAVGNPGPHGFTEVLYAFASAANNNGSAFGGLTANGTFYTTSIAIAMWIGRFGVIVPVLALAGSLAKKKTTPPGLGTLPTHSTLFVGLLIGVILLVGALTFIPALALGPVVEHLSFTSP
ncbi:MAG: potassium-transporting ATPase subunit KdpA [Polyangiaceae bacterium]|nr:potassium-transporting ATPase subunit KdpA [Polyangiaceae bacterium]